MKSLLQFFTVCSLLLPLTAGAKEQTPTQTIRGIAIDKSSGAPLSHISVGLSDIPGMETTTDDKGRFILPNVPVGRHEIRASSVGYESSVISEIMLTSAKETYLEIQLRESVRELDEIVINNRINKEEPLNNMALAGARMLSVEEARRYAGGFDDPARLASSFAGVSPSAGNNGISIHGNAPHLLQWKLEGIEIPNPNHFADIATLGGGVLSALSSNVLGNSDFFTGAFPAEYGNAVSGVFDMKMRNGNNQQHEHTAQFGLLGIDFASEGPLNRERHSSYIANYRYSTVSLLSKMESDLAETIDFQDLNFKMNFPTHKSGTFSVWGIGLIDKYKETPDEDSEKWENLGDRATSKADQIVAAAGINHRYFLRGGAMWITSLATTFARYKLSVDLTNFADATTPYMDSYNKYTNLIFQSSINKKFSSRFTNQTGITYTKMFYRMNFDLAPQEGYALNNISKGDGSTDLISVYNSSLISLGDNVEMSIGVNAQMMTLNKEWTVEPRVSLRWQASERSSFAVAYGLHSRMEKMDVYFVKTPGTTETANKKLGFTKSHHLMLSFAYRLGNDMHLKIEPYAQFLYDVPVMADSSYSVLNRRDFWVEDPLVNKGKGENFGVDITFEKYMTRGLYYMITASIFDSRYCGGDGIWHNTRYNRNYIINGLIGKEWMVGRHKHNVFGINLKLTLQGGERYSPVDEVATLADPDKEVQYDETRAFSKQMSPMILANYSISYKINRKRVSHEFAIQQINATRSEEFYGHDYNIKTNIIEKNTGKTVLTNISYKIQF